MAARRLIVVMLVLLGVSTVIAIIAPDPVEDSVEKSQNGDTSGSTGATDVTDAAGVTGTTGDTGSSEGVTGDTGSSGGGGNDPGDATAGGTGSGDVERSADGKTVTITTRVGPGTVDICVRPGTRLVLNFRTSKPLDIEISRFGRTVTATRFAPAVFDLLLPSQPGNFAVTELESERRLATVHSTRACGRVGAERAGSGAYDDTGAGAGSTGQDNQSDGKSGGDGGPALSQPAALTAI
jgi:hypothetical protein